MRRTTLAWLWLTLASSIGLGALGSASCSGDEEASKKQQQPVPDGGDAGGYPKPGPGEICEWPPNPQYVKITPQPSHVELAPGQKRTLELVIEPDVCIPTDLVVTSSDESIVASPAPVKLDLLTPKAVIELEGKGLGTATLTATFPRGDGTDATRDIAVEVMTPDIPKCSGSGGGKVDDGTTVKGTGGLVLASVGLQKGATQPLDKVTALWKAEPFDATIACAPDQVPAGFTALGPAVTFGPATKRFQREIPFSIPVNPAAIPPLATLRHVTVSYTGPRAKTPRAIPIANPRIVRRTEGYALELMSPWLGTYQAVAQTAGGTKTRTRHLTHRALIGISMGGGGTAMFGLRNHERFDVLAPLGGPVDWTWMLGHIERNHMGGFAESDGVTPGGLGPMPTPELPYEHPSTFNQWWYEYPKVGNGGSFPRSDYIQIFRDLALMFGNPNSYNAAPNAQNLPAGISPDDKSVLGDHPNRECAVYVEPIDGTPTYEKQKEIENSCPAERCAYQATLSGYYDWKYNRKGTFPVITVCDGSQQDSSKSPWANTWSDNIPSPKPLELALAVDYNGNGVRDEGEPVVTQGHERYDDVGSDGKASPNEPGYQAGVNEDPSGDDWHPQFNPKGTEGNGRWDQGEPYLDYGLDGVDGTKSSPYDWGEGNGKFDYAPGYRTFLERDSRTVLEQHPLGTEKKKLDDGAMARIDLWADGGTRDLFNFAVDAQALLGAWSARDRIVHYYTETQNIPGQDPANPKAFVAGQTDWSAVPSGVLLRYGKIDPVQKDIDTGSGQHVGTPDEITRRLQSALYYIGNRWLDAPRTEDEAANIDPDPEAEACVVNGACDFDFKGRPVSVNFPPGYAHKLNKEKRYPVIYLLHGYGQTPEDLKAAIVFLSNWMNFPGDSKATRLPKAIMVYVDGRCRPGPTEAECIRGTFYTDSVRANGAKIESYFLELMDWVDTNPLFRTMPPSDIEWTE